MTEAEAQAVIPPSQDQEQAQEVQQAGEAEPVYCTCRKPEAGFMVFCDGCEDWFHGDCVGIKKRQADKLQKYLCPKCAAAAAPTKPAQLSPDTETSKSRSGRSIKKKKWDEEEFEYDFKSKEDDDEDYEDEEEEEEERPRKVTPKKVATQHPPQQQYHTPQQQHHHHHHHHHQQQQQHHQQPQQQMYYSPNNNNNNNNNHYTHSNHLNLHHPTHPIQNSYNLNPTLQAINSINSYALNPHGHAPPPPHHMQQQPHYSTQLPHSLPIPQQTMGQMPLSGIQGPSPGSKRSYAATQLPPQQQQQQQYYPPSNVPPKSSPESKQKNARRESLPPGVKG